MPFPELFIIEVQLRDGTWVPVTGDDGVTILTFPFRPPTAEELAGLNLNTTLPRRYRRYVPAPE